MPRCPSFTPTTMKNFSKYSYMHGILGWLLAKGQPEHVKHFSPTFGQMFRWLRALAKINRVCQTVWTFFGAIEFGKTSLNLMRAQVLDVRVCPQPHPVIYLVQCSRAHKQTLSQLIKVSPWCNVGQHGVCATPVELSPAHFCCHSSRSSSPST